jgi:hypothetical protein
MSCFRQRSITGFAEVLRPFEINDFGRKAERAFHCSIRAAGIGDDNFINQGSDTLEGALDPILFILNDHAQRNPHTRRRQSRCVAKAGHPAIFDLGNYCLMSDRGFNDKGCVGSMSQLDHDGQFKKG